jgi:hypothetical protein
MRCQKVATWAEANAGVSAGTLGSMGWEVDLQTTCAVVGREHDNRPGRSLSGGRSAWYDLT